MLKGGSRGTGDGCATARYKVDSSCDWLANIGQDGLVGSSLNHDDWVEAGVGSIVVVDGLEQSIDDVGWDG